MQATPALDALGDPTRRRLLALLAARPSSVQQLGRRLGVTVSAVSQHLRTLRSAGLVTCDVQGRHRIYRLLPDALETVRREAAEIFNRPSSRAPEAVDDPLRALALQRARTWPQLDPLALLISFRLEQLIAAMRRDLQDIAAEAGLSRGEMLALGAIAAAGPPYETSPTDLKAALWISLPGIGKRLDLLESRGLIRRLPDPDDGRRQRIRLTDRGLAALGAARVGTHIPSHMALAGMPQDQRAELERLLGIWQHSIVEKPAD